MSLLTESRLDMFPPSLDPQVESQVATLLTCRLPQGQLVERRKEHRHPYPYLAVVSPVDDDSRAAPRPFTVAGKHLSNRGFGFYHPEPLTYRKVIVTLEGEPGAWLSFLLELTWCRFSRAGWYESGGRFLRASTAPWGPGGPPWQTMSAIAS